MTVDEATLTQTAVIPTEGRPAQYSQPGATPLEHLSARLEEIRRRCPNLPVLAIRWMHLKHPLHPIQEELIGDGRGTPPAADRETGGGEWGGIALVWGISYCLLYAVYLSCRLIVLHLVLSRQIASLRRRPFDLIAKTCCFGPGRPLGDRDFYYGDLQQRLARRGLRMLLLCADVTGGNWVTFAQHHVALPPLARLPEFCLLHPLRPIQLMGQQVLACLRLRQLAASSPDPVTRRIMRLASTDCLVPNTTFAALQFWVGRAAARQWRPRAFVTLYEGHAWEHCLRGGAKSAKTSCVTVGYQHSVVFRESLSLMSPSRDLAGWSLPDVVLCLSQAPLELMRPGHERYPTRLLRFGSFRYQTSAATRPADPGRRTVLVTPEGIMSEVQALFTFAASCARHMPSYTFVLRCHPEVPMSRALALVSDDLRQYPNILLSEHRPIEDDFARASALLYRGSTAALYAILHGLRPINLHVEGLRDRDPLFQLQIWRRRCVTPADVEAILDRETREPEERREREWAAAARYVQQCTEPVGENRVDDFLNAVGLGGSRRCIV